MMAILEIILCKLNFRQTTINRILKLKFAPVSYTKGLVTVEDIEQLKGKFK